MVFPPLAEEGDNAVGELAKGHRVEGRGVKPIDDERAVASDPFEAFARRPFRGGLGGIDEDFVVEDRGVERRDEFEKVGLAFEGGR
jgi:hypothetical protein